MAKWLNNMFKSRRNLQHNFRNFDESFFHWLTTTCIIYRILQGESTTEEVCDKQIFINKMQLSLWQDQDYFWASDSKAFPT